MLWYAGYRPERWFRRGAARSATLKRIGVLVVAILVLSAFLGGVTLDSFSRATTEERIRTTAASVVEEAEGSVGVDLRVLDVQVDYTNTALFRKANRVVVTVGIPPGETVSGMADRLDARLDGAAGHDIETEVRYVGTEGG